MQIWKLANSKPRIFLSGGWGYGNRGDNAILVASLQALKSSLPGVEIVVSSYNSIEILRDHNIPSVESVHCLFDNSGIQSVFNSVSLYMWLITNKKRLLNGKLSSYIEYIRGFDLVVLCGGGYFNEYWPSMARAQIALIELAELAGTPIVSIGQSIGPFSTGLLGRSFSDAIKKIDSILCRDADSVAFVRSHGVSDGNCGLSADMANLLAPETPRARPPASDPVKIGIMVQLFRRHSSIEGTSKPGRISSSDVYFSTLVDAFVEFAKEKSVQYVVIPSTTWDTSVCKKLVNALEKRGIDPRFVANPTVSEYISACQSVDIMVSTNMHPIILASTAGIPSLALSYNYKTDRYMEDLDMSEFCKKIDDFDSLEIIKSLEIIHDNMQKYQNIVETAHLSIREMAVKNVNLITKLFDFSV